MPAHCRNVAVSPYPIENIIGKKTYYTTEYAISKDNHILEIEAIEGDPTKSLLKEIKDFRILAYPEELLVREDETINPNSLHQMAVCLKKAIESGKKGIIVKGMFEHINFAIGDVEEITVQLVDIYPPESKLKRMVEDALKYDLVTTDKPINIEIRGINLFERADRIIERGNIDTLVFPCRIRDMPEEYKGIPVRFVGDSLKGRIGVVGCETTLKVLSGQPIQEVEIICPRLEVSKVPWISKCCQYHLTGMQNGGYLFKWGTSFQEVVTGIQKLVKTIEGDLLNKK